MFLLPIQKVFKLHESKKIYASNARIVQLIKIRDKAIWGLKLATCISFQLSVHSALNPSILFEEKMSRVHKIVRICMLITINKGALLNTRMFVEVEAEAAGRLLVVLQ